MRDPGASSISNSLSGGEGGSSVAPAPLAAPCAPLAWAGELLPPICAAPVLGVGSSALPSPGPGVPGLPVLLGFLGSTSHLDSDQHTFCSP